jgi:uncharacterized protein YigE (DUF2233 family)
VIALGSAWGSGSRRRLHLPLVLVLVLASALAAACSRASSAAPAVVQREIEHEGALWDVFEIDLTRAELRLYGQADPTLRTFAAVRAKLDRQGARWAMLTNGGIFHPGERPAGLHIEGGRKYAPLELADGEGNFFLKPNGVFYVDDRGAHVVPSDAYAASDSVALATQSGPLLLHANAPHPRFRANSTSLTKRSAVGVRDPQHVVLAVSRGPVSFLNAATLFRDALRCPDALYLDGTISDFATPARLPAEARRYGSVLAVLGLSARE